MVAFNNAKTDEDLDELFDRIANKLTLLKKLINTVSDIERSEETVFNFSQNSVTII